jgi:SAM-dependent methyltransferase
MVLSLDDCSRELQALENAAALELGSWRGIVSTRQYRGLVHTFAELAPPHARVLDWGSGQGAFSYWLVRNGYDVTGLDVRRPSLRPVVEALDAGRYRFVMADDPVRLPFDDDEFDVVTSVGVLEHVRETGGDEAGSLSEIRRVLRSQGRFVCVHVPNCGSWIEFLVRALGVHNRGHRFRYARDELDRLLRTAGFEALRWDRYGVFPRNSTNHLPLRLRNSTRLAGAVDAAEDRLAAPLQPILQNHAFVARPVP